MLVCDALMAKYSQRRLSRLSNCPRVPPAPLESFAFCLHVFPLRRGLGALPSWPRGGRKAQAGGPALSVVCSHVCNPGEAVPHSPVTHRCVESVVTYVRGQQNSAFVLDVSALPREWFCVVGVGAGRGSWGSDSVPRHGPWMRGSPVPFLHRSEQG